MFPFTNSHQPFESIFINSTNEVFHPSTVTSHSAQLILLRSLSPMASASSSHSTRLLLLLSILLLLSFALSVPPQRCSDCGSTPVPYPLSTGPNCGDQLYKIRCNAGRLFFDSLNNSYPIISISPDIQRLTIQPALFLPNTCISEDLSTEGIHLNPELPFNITSSNTVLFFNCTDILLRSPLNCTSTSLCHTFVNETADANAGVACGGSQICCTFKAGGSSTSYQIHVRNGGCRAYRSFVNLDYSLPVNRWPQPGLELQWVSPRENICGSQSDCDSDSTCGPDPTSTNGVRRCFCNSGFNWDPIVGVCAQGTSSSSGFSIYFFSFLFHFEKFLYIY